jgi:ABC-type antimicrobial peptide transport system permease subunit
MPGIAGARAFWESAESILRTVSFNLALFSVVTVLILVLAVFLYIRQRQRDFAILRALGNPARKTKKQLLSTLLIFALPAVMIGGAGGWLVAQNEAARALEALPTARAEIGMLWLSALIAIVLAGAFILSLIGIQMNRRPILEMLQGRVVK